MNTVIRNSIQSLLIASMALLPASGTAFAQSGGAALSDKVKECEKKYPKNKRDDRFACLCNDKTLNGADGAGLASTCGQLNLVLNMKKGDVKNVVILSTGALVTGALGLVANAYPADKPALDKVCTGLGIGANLGVLGVDLNTQSKNKDVTDKFKKLDPTFKDNQNDNAFANFIGGLTGGAAGGIAGKVLGKKTGALNSTRNDALACHQHPTNLLQFAVTFMVHPGMAFLTLPSNSYAEWQPSNEGCPDALTGQSDTGWKPTDGTVGGGQDTSEAANAASDSSVASDAGDGAQELTGAEKSATSNKTNSCFSAAKFLAFEAATNALQLTQSQKAFDTILDQAANQASANFVDTKPLAKLEFGGGTMTPVTNGDPGSAPQPKQDAGISGCDNLKGQAYLSCAGKTGAISSALTSGPFVGTMEKALGQNLGDFVKGFNGDSGQAAAAYAAQGLGLSSAAGSALAKLMDKANKDPGPTGLAYTSSGRGPANASAGDMDFSKMMADMMKKLNPDAAPAEKQDPQAAIDRQLDLMSADKVFNNQNISLFARIGYSYRKKIKQGAVEQLSAETP